MVGLPRQRSQSTGRKAWIRRCSPTGFGRRWQNLDPQRNQHFQTFRWKNILWFTTPTSARDQHLVEFNQNLFQRKEKPVKLFKFKFPIFNLFPRCVQLCGSGRPDGGESDLPRRMSTPRSPRLDPLLTVGSLQKYLEREWLLQSCWIVCTLLTW